MKHQNVLLTGVTGFVGSHSAIKLLDKGYKVTGTLRNMDRANNIKNLIGSKTKNIDNLKLVEADLNDKDIWNAIMKDMDYVMHIASPLPQLLPKNDEELIRPAKEGTLSILKAAAEYNVKRVVITSSMGAIIYGRKKKFSSRVFNEHDWTDVSNKKYSTPYYRSKTIAEKSAWDFISTSNSKLEISTICASVILGPVLESDFGTSANMIKKFMDGSVPVIPKMGAEIIDVRSVADLQIKAMEKEEARNERFICSSGFVSLKEINDILREKYPERKIPRFEIPNFLTRLIAQFEPTIKPILIDLGVKRQLDNTKAIEKLNWKPRSTKEAILTCAESMIELELV